MSSGQQFTMPASIAFTADGCKQPVHLVRFIGWPVFNRVDAMAACSQFVRNAGADAGGIGQHQPGRYRLGASVVTSSDVAHH